MRSEMRLDSAARDIRSDLQKAKLVAIRKNSDCVMRFNATSPGGYRACVDADGSNSCDPGEEIVLEKDFSDYPHVSLVSAAFTSGTYIQFNSRGSTGSIAGWSAGSVNCTNDKGEMKQVTVTRTGEIYID
jgi:Tfp pilus assembly protein FimT